MDSSTDFGLTTTAGEDDCDSSDANLRIRAEAAEVPAAIGRYRVRSLLGYGTYGTVYLVFDEHLERQVAVKVPHHLLVPGPEAAESYLAEAQAVACLDHPGIVPVYDVGSCPEFPCFIVSKFIEGQTLAQRLKADLPWPSFADVARLVTSVAEALHHAHLRRIVHRDIKPGNILLDRDGRPYVADFGLALRERNFGTGPLYTGSPAYMSPEQARGEGHRVDGRSDIFSLGSVFYELLTRSRPFRSHGLRETLRQVAEAEPRLPRELNPEIARELERICLKALARRASERYATALDLADDLRYFLVSDARGGDVPTHRLNGQAGLSLSLSGSLDLTHSTSSLPMPDATVKVTPRGLRSFDAADADFFLSLLPGPRGREGLPESLRFWKTGAEQTDAEETFRVGLLYGPSGCGKSSLIKAGLLPRLAPHVLPIYVEATADGTESRLMAALVKRCPGLHEAEDLRSALASLRRGQHLPAGRKVLIVLDQFEQWLHARRETPQGELAEALRQCDGGRVQCLVLIRDDFWMAATRFMRELEVPLVEGQNSAAVDLFPVRHAEKVLQAFGRAFGALPDEPVDLTREQRLFLKQAVAGLAQEGKVICVRLALFAQMMKDRPWTPGSLRGVGGALGVGATFLEETFSAAVAPPEHRYHQAAARAILKALSPIAGTDIKGNMRSEAELLELSGYAGRSQDFAELLQILDGELRLITPTDPEGLVNEPVRPRQDGPPELAGSTPSEPPSALMPKFYQLTHDYLVPSLRDWLTRKLRETRRGRAELRLAERTTLWIGRPENRFLPSSWEWMAFRRFIRPRDWTAPQQAMMRRAARYHAGRSLLLAAGLVGLGLLGWEGYGRQRAQGLRHRLLEARTEDVPGIVLEMAPYRRWLDEPLRHDFEAPHNPYQQLHASLGLLPVDARQVKYLLERLLTATPQEVIVIRAALRPHAAQADPFLWQVLEDKKKLGEHLRVASALAPSTAGDERWAGVSGDVAARLVAENGLAIGRWAEALQPIRHHLLPRLATLLVAEGQEAARVRTMTRLYSDYAQGVPDAFSALERLATEPIGTELKPADRLAWQQRQANAAAVLAALGRWGPASRLLAHSPDPTVRSYLIDRLGPSGAGFEGLVERFNDADALTRRAAVLALAEFDEDRLPPGERDRLTARLVAMYRDDPDPGIHGAIDWLLRQWNQQDRLAEAARPPVSTSQGDSRVWSPRPQGQTMVHLPPGSFRRGEGAEQERIEVDHGFAISAREVTVAEFHRFRPDHLINDKVGQTEDCPVHKVSWYDAAAYCNWLSKQEGVPEDQWCYLPNPQGEYAEGMKLVGDFLLRSGYRLPTKVEWEYACRAGSSTGWSLGEAEDLLKKYAWFVSNSRSQLHPVAMLRPNDWGLFDMHGNAWEWCQDKVAAASGDSTGVATNTCERVARGGAFGHGSIKAESVGTVNLDPMERGIDLGFRLAQTHQ